ncbi:MAG: hypothetical protein ABI949_02900 [Ilumatobacteraceae bacterium]
MTTNFRVLEAVSNESYLGDADLTRRSSKFMADPHFAAPQRLRDQYQADRRFFDFRPRPGCEINELEPC